MAGNGKLTYLLRPLRNSKGPYFMGNGNLPVSINLSEAIFFAYPQPDGTLMLSIERYDSAKEGRQEEEEPRCQIEKRKP